MNGSFNLEIKKGKVVNLMESGNSLPILPLRLQSVRSFAGNTNDRMYMVSLLDSYFVLIFAPKKGNSLGVSLSKMIGASLLLSPVAVITVYANDVLDCQVFSCHLFLPSGMAMRKRAFEIRSLPSTLP